MEGDPIADLPDGWARCELEPIDWSGRHTADEIMVSRGKLTKALVTKGVLKREPGSKLRKRLLTTAIRGGLGLNNRREYDRLLDAVYAKDCELTFEAFFPDMEGGKFRGRDGIKQNLLSFDDAFSSLTFQPREIIDPGGRTIAAAVAATGVGRTTGIPITGLVGIVYTLDRGMVTSQEVFADLPSAVERLKQRVGAGESIPPEEPPNGR